MAVRGEDNNSVRRKWWSKDIVAASLHRCHKFANLSCQTITSLRRTSQVLAAIQQESSVRKDAQALKDHEKKW